MPDFTPIKRKIPVIVAKLKSFLDVKQHPVWQAVTFGLIVGIIGGFIIWHSMAATTPPASPTHLMTTPVSSSEIDLSWQASTSDEVVGYNIYKIGSLNDSADGDTTSTPDELVGQTKGASVTTYQLTGLNSDTTYGFYVEARDAQGNTSLPSEQMTDTTLDAPNSNEDSATTSSSSSLADASRITWPYSSPLGDKSCQKTQGGTVYSDCYCNSVSNYTDSSTTPSVRYKCVGSCVASNATGTFVPLDGCRPMTMITTGCDVAGGPQPTWSDTGIDQGVDFAVTNFGCNNNPNPDDTGGKAANSRVYAAGNGVIKCVLANSSVKTQWCPDNPSPSPYNRPANSGTWLIYQLKNNKGKADGLYIYVSEGCVLSSNAVNDVTAPASSSDGNSPGHRNLGRSWKVGDNVTANSVLCEIGDNNSPYSNNIEMGWSSSSKLAYLADTPMWLAIQVSADGLYNRPAAGTPGSSGWVFYGATQWGYSFAEFMAKSGLPTGGLKPIHEFQNTGTGAIRQINGKATVNGVGPAYHYKWYGIRKYPMPAKYQVTPSKGGWWNPNGP